jgi:rRNA maturation endonuclease Nob1
VNLELKSIFLNINIKRMSCKPTVCSVCHGTFPACQIKNGKCASCRAKETAPAAPASKNEPVRGK